MLKRGDIVTYRWHGAKDADMNGAIAVVKGLHPRYREDSVLVSVLLAPPATKDSWSKSWWDESWFDVKNCEKIGHIDLPPDF